MSYVAATHVKCNVLRTLLLTPLIGFGAQSLAAVAPPRIDAGWFVPITQIEMQKPDRIDPQADPSGEAAEIAILVRDKAFDKALARAVKFSESHPTDPMGYNLLGAAYLGKKDIARARSSLEQALAVRPGDETALLALGRLEADEKKPEAARKWFQALLTKDPTNVQAMLGLAQVDFLKDDDKSALAWLEKAKLARPEMAAPRISIAAYHVRRTQYAQAIDELTAATRAIPGNVDVLDMLGKAQLGAGQTSSAITTFRQLVAAQPQAPLAHYRLAVAYLAGRNESSASLSLRKALELQPKYVEALGLLSEIESNAKHYSEALKLAKQVQALQPKSPVGTVLEGDILSDQGQHADAVAPYAKALALGKSGLVLVKLHDAKTKAGNAKEADDMLAQWLHDHPKDTAALQYSAALYAKRGNNRIAIDQYEQALRIDPNNALLLNNLASVYQREGDSRARATAEAAYRLDPDSAFIADTLGWILVEQGKTSDALPLLETALRKDSKNPEIRYHLAAALAKAGDKARAKRELEKLVAEERTFSQREAAQALLKQL